MTGMNAGQAEVMATKRHKNHLVLPAMMFRAPKGAIRASFAADFRAFLWLKMPWRRGMAEKAVDESGELGPINVFNAVTRRNLPTPTTNSSVGGSVTGRRNPSGMVVGCPLAGNVVRQRATYTGFPFNLEVAA
jgi:hypothetical protein